MDIDPIPLEELLAAGAEQRDGHGKVTTILGSSAAIASMISSSALIWMIRRSRDGLATAYHRILLGMCVADIALSLGLAHFNVTAPRDVDYYVWNASGNQLSCNVQGFVGRAGVLGAVLYSCSLNLYSLAVVRYRKTDDYIRRKHEPFLHGVPIVYALVASTALLVENNFNDGGGGNCYAPEYRPPHCIGYEDGRTREGFDIPCGRGSDGAVLFSYVSGFIALFVVPLVIVTSLGMIYRSVLQQEEQMERYGAGSFAARDRRLGDVADERVSWSARIRSVFKCIRRSSEEQTSTSNQNQRQSNSRAVMHRALAYSTSYFLTWSWFIIGTFCELAGMEWPTILWYLANIFNPLQGVRRLATHLIKQRSVHPSSTNATHILLLNSSVSSSIFAYSCSRK